MNKIKRDLFSNLEIKIKRGLSIYIPLVAILSVFRPTHMHGQGSSDRKNFVLYHYSANKKYELISVPEADVGNNARSFTYINDRKSGRCLYRFSPEFFWNGTADDLFLLSNDGKTVYQFYANLNGRVDDPTIHRVLVYKEGILSDTIEDKALSDFLHGFCYPYKIKKLVAHFHHKRPEKKTAKRLKTNRGTIEAWGDTLKLQGWRKSVLYCSYATFKPIIPNITTNKKTHYQKLYYRIVFMDAYKRDKLYDWLDEKMGMY